MLIETNSHFIHDNAYCSKNLMPHSQNLKVLESCHPYRIQIRSQNNCLVRTYPSCFSGRVVNQAETPVFWFKLLVRKCSEFMCQRMTSSFYLFCSTLAVWILFLMVWISSSGSYWGIWLMIFVDKNYMSLMEFLNSSLLISAKICILSPPNLGGSAINFLSISLQKFSPVIAGMNWDCTTSSKRWSCVNAPEIVSM